MPSVPPGKASLLILADEPRPAITAKKVEPIGLLLMNRSLACRIPRSLYYVILWLRRKSLERNVCKTGWWDYPNNASWPGKEEEVVTSHCQHI